MLGYLPKTGVNVRDIMRYRAGVKSICALAIAGWAMALMLPLQADGQPVIDVDPDSRDYGDVWVGDQDYYSFTVYNMGDATLNVSNIRITGTDVDDFSIANDEDFSLEPGMMGYSIGVYFMPSSLGYKSANLSLDHNAGPGPDTLHIPLEGTGRGSVIVVEPDPSPDPYDYGDVEALDGIYSEVTFTVRNEGNATLNVSNVYLYYSMGWFSIDSGDEDFSLEPYDPGDPDTWHEIVVRFDPHSEGESDATLRLYSNDPNQNTKEISLRGNGTSLFWSIALYISLEYSPWTNIQCNAGAHPDATDDLDVVPGASWDKPALPLGPPGEPVSLDAYFDGADPFPKLERDYRQDMPEDRASFDQTYTLHVHSDGVQFSISWNVFGLPSDPPDDLNAMITQVDPASGDPLGPPLNMRNYSSFSPLPPGEYEFRIRIRQKVDVLLDIPQGWSMMSISGVPDVAVSVADLINDTPVDAVYTWDPATSGYMVPSIFEFGPGYWFHSAEETQIIIPDCYPQYTLTLPVLAGWNMVGSISEYVPVDRLKPRDKVLDWVYRWYSGTGWQGYDSVSSIGPQDACWVAVIEDCDLIIDNTAPAPPAAKSQPIVRNPSWESVIAIQTQGLPSNPRVRGEVKDQHQELVFGMHPSASGSFDRLLDRPLPPLPVWTNDSLKAGWMIEDTLFSLLDKSFVADGSRAIWELSVELPESGELQWRNLPTEYRCLLWYDGQVIRMQDETAMSLPPGSHKLKLVLDSFESLPERTELLPNYPNPANPETWIPYRLAEDGDVRLVIYDILGREIRQFHLYNQLAGEYRDKDRAIHWDGRTHAGEIVSSGVYFYSLQTAGTVSDETKVSQTGKLVIIR